jgi:hypothetical protein
MYKRLLISQLLFFCSFIVIGQDPIAEINATISQQKVKAHLSFLASDALRGRDTGSEGLEAAAAYIASHFITHGVDTVPSYGDYLQKIPFVKLVPPDSARLMVGGRTLIYPQDFLILNGGKQNTTMPGQFLSFGKADDFVGKDMRFNFAVTNAGDGETQDIGAWVAEAGTKRERAIESGAMGLIEIYQNSAVPWRFLQRMASQERLSSDVKTAKEAAFPHLWVSATDSVAISALKGMNGSIRLDMDGVERSPRPSANVLGWVEGTDPELKNEYIIYSAHYDHIGVGIADAKGDTIYNGARDNAVGATAVMLLAEYIAAHPTKRSALFVFFTAEEKGLLGSDWFVDHCPVPLEKVKYNFNIDNGGYNDTSIISVIGLTRTEAEQDIQASCNAFGLTAIEDPAKEQGLFDRSDNVNFARKGIPAPTFSLGFRSFDAEIFKYYHQAGDQVESLDMNYIHKYVKSYILSATKIGNANKAPFWLEGDKYYEAGVQLYQNK